MPFDKTAARDPICPVRKRRAVVQFRFGHACDRDRPAAHHQGVGHIVIDIKLIGHVPPGRIVHRDGKRFQFRLLQNARIRQAHPFQAQFQTIPVRKAGHGVVVFFILKRRTIVIFLQSIRPHDDDRLFHDGQISRFKLEFKTACLFAVRIVQGKRSDRTQALPDPRNASVKCCLIGIACVQKFAQCESGGGVCALDRTCRKRRTVILFDRVYRFQRDRRLLGSASATAAKCGPRTRNFDVYPADAVEIYLYPGVAVHTVKLSPFARCGIDGITDRISCRDAETAENQCRGACIMLTDPLFEIAQKTDDDIRLHV